MTAQPSSAKAIRQKRLAEALRANLRRRKAAAEAKPSGKLRNSAGDKEAQGRS